MIPVECARLRASVWFRASTPDGRRSVRRARASPGQARAGTRKITLTKASDDIVDSIHLLDLASQQARWLAVRESTVAANISNANTPGFKANDVTPFEDILNDGSLRMTATSPAHFGLDPLAQDAVSVKDGGAWEASHSGNTVSLEKEMIKAGEINRAYALNTSVVKAFNRMFLASVKG